MHLKLVLLHASTKPLGVCTLLYIHYNENSCSIGAYCDSFSQFCDVIVSSLSDNHPLQSDNHPLQRDKAKNAHHI
jgi:hypothetical protein